MVETLREFDLLGSFSHVSATPRSVLEVRDDFLPRSISPVSNELLLSISPGSSEFSWRSRREHQHEKIQTAIPKENPQLDSPGDNSSSLISRFRVSWGSKRRRISPIRQIRVSRKIIHRPTNEELLPDEKIAVSGLLMLANQNPWKITKILKESDLNDLSRLLISKALVQEHIIPHLDEPSRRKVHSKDGLVVSVRDCDTDQVFELKLKWWNSSKSYNIQGGWRSNFVKRRRLELGDKIGLFWDGVHNLFVFSVLQQAKLANVC